MNHHRVKEKKERLRSAAIVKLKYRMVSGGLDKGFDQIFKGVIKDLGLTESEVDRYLEENLSELESICLKE